MRTGPAGPISYAHLLHLSDGVGVFEHAELRTPRREHGYCVDDVARVLVVAAREPHPSPELLDLARLSLAFVLDAVADDGRVHNRRVHGGGWADRPGVEDCWGRALWGLGTLAARMRAVLPKEAQAAYHAFEAVGRQRSQDRHAMAFAALGAAEVLTAEPRHAAASGLLDEAATLLDTAAMVWTPPGTTWPWPEPRLRYASAALPEVLVAAGELLEDDGRRRRGLQQLEWLVDLETGGTPGARHRSVVPAGGWEPGEPRPGFDQQPIEVAALADACARAADVTREHPEAAVTRGWRDWEAEVLCCEAWFLGANDVGIPMVDEASGGGYDGLMPGGRNENEGAESTLALVATRQQADRVRTRP